jgi:putative transposase
MRSGRPRLRPASVARQAIVKQSAERGACEALAVDRSSVRYKPIRPDDADLRVAMKAVAVEQRRFGYRRIHVMLDRQGIVMNLKKLRRLYRKEKL